MYFELIYGWVELVRWRETKNLSKLRDDLYMVWIEIGFCGKS